MKPELRARLAAGLLGLVALGLLARSEWAAGVGVASVSLAILVLVTERGAPDVLGDAGALGLQESTGALVASLRLEGRAILQPGRTPDAPSRLFVPAADVPLAEIASVDLGETLQREAGAPLGVALAPPGAGLEAAWRARGGLPEGKGPEEAALHLRRAFADLELGRDVTLARGGDVLRVAYVPTAFADACRRAQEQGAWHVQGGCPACSFAAILVARAHAAPVRTLASGADGARSWIELEVGARSPA